MIKSLGNDHQTTLKSPNNNCRTKPQTTLQSLNNNRLIKQQLVNTIQQLTIIEIDLIVNKNQKTTISN